MRSNRYGAVAILLAVLGGTTPVLAQGTSGLFGGSSVGPNGGLGNYSGSGGGGDGLQDAGGLPGQDRNLNYFTAPLGTPAKQGPFVYADIVYFTQTWTLGTQTVAVRGLRDTTGVITGTPGTLIGSGEAALTTDQFGRTEYSPGVNLGVGWKFDDGSVVTARIMHVSGQTFAASASLATPFARSRTDLSDTFLLADVFNFPPQFAGPRRKTAFEGTRVGDILDIFGNIAFNQGIPLAIGRTVPDGAFYGIWNGASVMTIAYETDYTEAEIGGRVPLFESSSSKIYGLGGMRYHHFMERFRWTSQSFAVDGNSGPQDFADYTNKLSQRLYGPYAGCAHDVFLGNKFSLSAEMTGGVFANVIRRSAKYELGNETIQNKRSTNELGLSATGGASASLWWYPTKGVQVRAGYQANTFWNTERMRDPIAFNYGALDPVYGTQYFRIIHGLQFGFSLFF